MKWFKRIALLTILLCLQACAGQQHLSTEKYSSGDNSATLYQQLGGRAGVDTLVDVFIHHIARDNQVFHYFAKANVTHFRKGFTQHLCAVTNGPCVYTGDSMVDIHTGMHINEADFNRIVELLVASMEQLHIPYTTQNRLLSRLAPLRKDIIKR